MTARQRKKPATAGRKSAARKRPSAAEPELTPPQEPPALSADPPQLQPPDYRQEAQNLVLWSAASDPAVRYGGAVLQPVVAARSPLDVPGVRSKLRRGELTTLVREERERSGERIVEGLFNQRLQASKARKVRRKGKASRARLRG